MPQPACRSSDAHNGKATIELIGNAGVVGVREVVSDYSFIRGVRRFFFRWSCFASLSLDFLFF
jgi:uncharacterized membrane protein